MAQFGQGSNRQGSGNYPYRASSAPRRDDRPRTDDTSSLVSDSELKQIIEGNELSATKLLVTTAEALGSKLKELNLKSSQIRTIFGTVRQIEMSWMLDGTDPAKQTTSMRKATTQLVLLKPKMAYQAMRNEPVKPLADILSRSIDLVGENRENFQRFVDFFEAILAYHKAKGGE